MMNKEEQTLMGISVKGNIAYLPQARLDRKTYLEIAKKLELIGGKWRGGKIGGFVFQEDPTDLIIQIQNGEKRNLKKEFQFFATPPSLARQLVELAEIKPGHRILEPSAGQGAIVKAIHEAHGANTTVHCFELMELNRSILRNLSGVNLIGEDFLSANSEKYDRIVANPPFTKNQDIDHIGKMYDCLVDGGRIVTIASTSWRNGRQKKQTAFREWVEGNSDIQIIDVGSGAFKESGTTVPSVILLIEKRMFSPPEG